MKAGDLVLCVIHGNVSWMYVRFMPTSNYITLTRKPSGNTGPSDVYRLSDIKIIAYSSCLF